MQRTDLRVSAEPPGIQVVGRRARRAQICQRCHATQNGPAGSQSATLPHEERQGPQRDHSDPEHPDPEPAVGHQPQVPDRDIADVRSIHRREFGVSEVPQHRECVGAVVLQRALGQVLRRIVGLMVHVGPAHAGEVQPLSAGFLEGREIRVVRHALIDLVGHRIRRRIRTRLAQRLDHPAVGGARLEHHRRAATSAHLERQHDRHILHPRVFVDEGARTEKADFLGVGEQDDEVVAKSRTCAQGSNRFQDRGHARTVVSRSA